MDGVWIISKYVFYLPANWVIFFIVLLRLIFKTKGKESNKILFWYTSFVFLMWVVFSFRVEALNLGTKIVSPYSYVFYFQLLSPLVFYFILFYFIQGKNQKQDGFSLRFCRLILAIGLKNL